MPEIDFLQLFLKIICGLIASYFFLIILLNVYKPKLRISNFICRSEEDLAIIGEDGTERTVRKTLFRFKVVNLSRFNAYDVKFNLNLRTPYIVNGNKVNHRISPIKLRKDFLPYIPKFTKEVGVAEHAILLGTLHDIESNINQSNLDYELTVMAKHGFSNMTSVVFKRFSSQKNVKINKEFVFGKSLDVKE